RPSKHRKYCYRKTCRKGNTRSSDRPPIRDNPKMAERGRHEHYCDPEYNGSRLFIRHDILLVDRINSPDTTVRRAAEKRDRFVSVHSITSSSRSMIDGGTSIPSAVAAVRFTTISNFVGNCTGRSPGFSPRRMRST